MTRLLAIFAALLIAGPARADVYADAYAALDSHDDANAVALLTPLAERGEPLAQTHLAYLVLNGRGTAADAAAAARWWHLAAEQGDANAQYNLGVMYENGTGVEKDLVEAANWWRRAARQGYAEAQYNLGAFYYNGRGVAKDYVRAYVWKSFAAEGELTTVPQRRARTNRDAIGAVMSRAQLAQARELIALCRASDFEECD